MTSPPLAEVSVPPMEVVLEDLEVSGRCGSVGSLSLVTTASTLSPRGLGSRKVSSEVKQRKTSSGPGLATKRAELLQQKPIKPNTKVGSKLKAMLSENEENNKGRSPRVRKPSRWDAVMNKIEEGKQTVRPVSRSGLRSRLLTRPGTRPGSPASSELTRQPPSRSVTLTCQPHTHNVLPTQVQQQS